MSIIEERFAREELVFPNVDLCFLFFSVCVFEVPVFEALLILSAAYPSVVFFPACIGPHGLTLRINK